MEGAGSIRWSYTQVYEINKLDSSIDLKVV
jgi:hypothetical protein